MLILDIMNGAIEAAANVNDFVRSGKRVKAMVHGPNGMKRVSCLTISKFQ